MNGRKGKGKKKITWQSKRSTTNFALSSTILPARPYRLFTASENSFYIFRTRYDPLIIESIRPHKPSTYPPTRPKASSAIPPSPEPV